MAVISVVALVQFVKSCLPKPPNYIHNAESYIGQAKHSNNTKERTDLYRMARDELQNAIQIKQDLCSVHLNLGLVYWALEELDSVEQHLKQAIECAPKNAMMHYHLAVYLIKRQGYTSKAGEMFRQALSLGVAKRFQRKFRPFCDIIRIEPAFRGLKANKFFQIDLEQHGFPACPEVPPATESIPIADIEDGFWWINEKRSHKVNNDHVIQRCVAGATHVQPIAHPNSSMSKELQRFVGKHPARSASNDSLDSFCIQNHEVTIGEFNRFLSAQNKPPLRRDPNFPAEGISRSEAKEYAEWLKTENRRPWRLPTIGEWRLAALQYGEQDPVFADISHPDPKDRSPARISNIERPQHLLGNLREWSRDDCPSGQGIQLLGGNYLSGARIECYHGNDERAPGVGFRLLYPLKSKAKGAGLTIHSN